MTYAIADDAHITDIAGSNISHRTFDDFLDELYRVFKLRYVRHGEDEVNNRTSSHGQNSVRCISKFFSRKVQQLHYFPLPLLALCIANSSDATEILMLSYLLANPNFHQDMFGQDESGSKIEGVEYLASSIFFGMLIGGTILGFLSDFIGRKPALLIGLSTNAIAGTLSSVPFMTPSFVELTMLRFIAGVGIGATVPPLFSLASEWSPKKIRGGVVTVVASFWMVGSLFVSGVAWCLFQGFGDDIDSHRNTTMWRIFAASCALPSAMGALMVYRYVPESPRFLIARGHYSQAARSCNQITCILKIPFSVAPIDIEIHNNYSKNNDVGTHHREMSHIQVVDEKELKTSTPAHDNHVINTQQPDFTQSMEIFIDTLRKLYSRQTLSKTTLLLQSLWFSLSFGTYGITTWINRLFVAVHLQNLYLNSFLFALANLPGNIICIKYSDKWGRKIMLVTSLLGAACSLAGFAMLVYSSGNQNEAPSLRTCSIVLCACFFQMFSIISWNTIDIISGELFPTRVRSAGVGICTASGRLGAMVAQVANARLMISSDSEANVATESVASAWVLIVASSALLSSALVPIFLGQDASGGELKEDVTVLDESSNLSKIVSCRGMWKLNKEHLSDEEYDSNDAFTRASRDSSQFADYDSPQQEIEANQPFLL